MFKDRRDAGRQLAERLVSLRGEAPIVVSLPYGALEVADEIADGLQAPLRLILARPIHLPGTRSVVGAVSEGGAFTLTDAPGMPRQELEHQVALETVELYRRSSVLRRYAPPIVVVRRTIVVVDDGSSRPEIVEAAIGALQAERPGRVLFATPLLDQASFLRIQQRVDDVIFLQKVERFAHAPDHYESFPPVGDDAVMEILRERGM